MRKISDLNTPKEKAEIAVIGGTGVYDPTLFQKNRELKIFTPYGSPSPFLSVGEYEGRTVAFIPRHGKDHSIPPHMINYRANIYALKSLGVERIISVSSVGSLREDLWPGQFVFPDQFIDRTKRRPDTFFDGAKVAHVSSAEAFCPEIRKILAHSATKLELKSRNDSSTYVCIEGPRFSSKAESKLFRQWGADVVGMTLYPECILAREAEICYASISMVTDYDVWAERPVSATDVSAVMTKNVGHAKKLIVDAISALPKERNNCNCGSALSGAML
jgi:5'-methylthioadenosine phosphorylase